MKYIRKYEYFKLYENNDIQIKNESLLKKLLMKNQYFAKGEILLGLSSIIWNYTRDNQLRIEDGIEWAEDNFGDLPVLAAYLNIYNGQVVNGGHTQYFDNGYASGEHRGFGSEYKDIETHEKFVRLFSKLNFDEVVPLGNDAFDIISDFDLPEKDQDDDGMMECPDCDRGTVDCSTCYGSGYIDCPECDGSGEDEKENDCSHCRGRGNMVCDKCDGSGREDCEFCDGEGRVDDDSAHENMDWSRLDDRWYEINDQFMDQINEYLKTLTLDGEKVSELIKVAGAEQKFNI